MGSQGKRGDSSLLTLDYRQKLLLFPPYIYALCGVPGIYTIFDEKKSPPGTHDKRSYYCCKQRTIERKQFVTLLTPAPAVKSCIIIQYTGTTETMAATYYSSQISVWTAARQTDTHTSSTVHTQVTVREKNVMFFKRFHADMIGQKMRRETIFPDPRPRHHGGKSKT